MMKYRLSLLAVLLVGSLTLTACTSKVVTQNDNNQPNQDIDVNTPPVEPVKPVASVTVAGEVALVNNTVTIDKVVSVGPGWMTIHADKNGSVGDVIGHTAVVDGDNTNVVVTIDPKKATPKLYAMLHVDAGTVGTYEFPGADVPALAADGSMISPAFMVAKSTTPVATSSNIFTLADVTKHNTPSDCYSAINGSVYNLTAWIEKHPGGDRAILSICGKDGSSAFNGKHGTQPQPTATLAKFKIGTLK